MPVHRLNHAVLYVRDAPASGAFYREVLGFRVVSEMAGGSAVFLQAPGSDNDHDLGLFTIGPEAASPSAGPNGSVGLYHLAWEVDTLDELRALRDELSRRGHLVGATDHGTTKALYARDPDGIEFEVSWLVPADRLDDEALAARARLEPLDLAAEIERYGSDTVGGLGISRPSPSSR